MINHEGSSLERITLELKALSSSQDRFHVTICEMKS